MSRELGEYCPSWPDKPRTGARLQRGAAAGGRWSLGKRHLNGNADLWPSSRWGPASPRAAPNRRSLPSSEAAFPEPWSRRGSHGQSTGAMVNWPEPWSFRRIDPKSNGPLSNLGASAPKSGSPGFLGGIGCFRAKPACSGLDSVIPAIFSRISIREPETRRNRKRLSRNPGPRPGRRLPAMVNRD